MTTRSETAPYQEAPAAVRRPRLGAPSLESLFIAALVLFGWRLGARHISDNSMLAHLRTGIDMVAGKGIPRHDPYSFTAHGTRWVVQSWFAEWTYGVANRIGQLRLVIIEQAVLTGALAWLIARLARAGTPLRTAAGASIAVGVGAAYWSQRPLLFGLICLALTVTVVERRHNPLWLLPIVWVWANSHGSFPLGVAWLVLVAVGHALDTRGVPSELVRYLAAFLVGLGVACLNPIGPRLLTFAAAVGQKQQVFRSIVEWHSPDFQRPEGLFTLAFLLLTTLVLARSRAPWRDAIPVVAFVGLGLIAVRNIAPAGVVIAPAMARALRARDGNATRVARTEGPVVNLALLFVIVAGMAVFAADATSGRLLDLRSYPTAAATYVERAGLRSDGHRIATQDDVGDYLILRYGRDARVFIDDRYDMYPVAVSKDYEALLRGSADSARILARYRVDVVLWDRGRPLVPILTGTGQWHEVYRQKNWVVLSRR